MGIEVVLAYVLTVMLVGMVFAAYEKATASKHLQQQLQEEAVCLLQMYAAANEPAPKAPPAVLPIAENEGTADMNALPIRVRREMAIQLMAIGAFPDDDYSPIQLSMKRDFRQWLEESC